MLTNAQKRFNDEYLIVRRLLVAGELEHKDSVRIWLRQQAKEVLTNSTLEIMYSPVLRKRLSAQSGYERDWMKFIHENEPYEGNKGE